MTRDSSGIHRVRRPVHGVPVDRLSEAAEHLQGVRRREIAAGDRIIVATKNSIYSLTACGDGSFIVSGGWFEREGRGATRLEVHGCTAGGRALFTDLIAAPGLFLELSDGTQTTRIRSVRRIRRADGSN
jgi:hypothetical protein